LEPDLDKLKALIKEKLGREPLSVIPGKRGVRVVFKAIKHLDSREEALVQQLAFRTLKLSAEVDYQE